MKAEHRHELKTNALAENLNRLLQGLKTAPSRHTIVTWVVIGVIAVIALGGYFWWKTERDNRSALWLKVDDAERKLDDAANPDDVEAALGDLKKLADDHPGTLQARVVRFDRARALFHRGLERLYADHDKAVEDLTKARDLYAELSKEPGGSRDNNPLLAQEALMNVAKANESLGELDDAQKGYEKLAQAYPNTVLGKAADERAKYLADDANRAKVKQLYDKLGDMTKPEPKPAEAPGKKD
jgi:tetratricopeptide (TPR) repeat protein